MTHNSWKAYLLKSHSVTVENILDNECKIMRSEFGRITHEVNDMKLSIKGNADKGKSATT